LASTTSPATGQYRSLTAFTASIGSLHAYDEMLGALIELAGREERE